MSTPPSLQLTSAPSWVQRLQPASPQGPELLATERSQSNVSVESLSTFLFTSAVLSKRRDLIKILKREPVFDKTKNYYEGRVEKFKMALARAKRLRQLQVEHHWDQETNQVAANYLGEPNPYGLHNSMYLTTLRDQGTPEQHKLFLEPAENYHHIGCYAQTELGHGSNVRSLETTATWNAERKVFVMHSPTLTASKWWIGSLGRTANHASVMAQLIVGGKNYGPHPFVVPIRDMKTHEPLEGRYIGDIGPKVGYNTMDNGFLLLNNVEIPHVNMLAKHSRVDPETNQYVKPSSPNLVYGTMTWVRSTIVLEAGSVLARGVTIAIRYTAIRRQFQDRDTPPHLIGKGENQVLDYTMVQYRLLPLLASTFALHFTGKGMMQMYKQRQASLANEGKDTDLGSSKRGAGPEEVTAGSDMVADLHATSCGLKALGSTIAGEGLEVCRRACGGHGYSSFSGIGSFHADYLPTLTWEGDNYMLTQQVARYLLKTARSVLKGNPTKNDTERNLAFYLSNKDSPPSFDILNNDKDVVAAFAWRASYLTFEALRQRDQEKASWNSLLVDFWRLSTAHSQSLVVKYFYDALQSDTARQSLDSSTASVMRALFQLFSLYTLENAGQEFFASRAVNGRQLLQIKNKAVLSLMEQIRPHAVRLVDAWQIDDWVLDSSLGRSDGNVYPDLFYRASQLNPLNGLTVDPYPTSNVMIRRDETAKYSSATQLQGRNSKL